MLFARDLAVQLNASVPQFRAGLGQFSSDFRAIFPVREDISPLAALPQGVTASRGGTDMAKALCGNAFGGRARPEAASTPRLPKASQGFPRLPKASQGFPRLPKASQQGFPRLPSGHGGCGFLRNLEINITVGWSFCHFHAVTALRGGPNPLRRRRLRPPDSSATSVTRESAAELRGAIERDSEGRSRGGAWRCMIPSTVVRVRALSRFAHDHLGH